MMKRDAQVLVSMQRDINRYYENKVDLSCALVIVQNPPYHPVPAVCQDFHEHYSRQLGTYERVIYNPHQMLNHEILGLLQNSYTFKWQDVALRLQYEGIFHAHALPQVR